MKVRVPVIKPASDTPIGKFNIGFNQSEEVKRKLEKLMAKRGNHTWRIPRDELVIEPVSEMVNIMQQAPVGEQAIIGRTPVTIRRKVKKGGR